MDGERRLEMRFVASAHVLVCCLATQACVGRPTNLDGPTPQADLCGPPPLGIYEGKFSGTVSCTASPSATVGGTVRLTFPPVGEPTATMVGKCDHRDADGLFWPVMACGELTAELTFGIDPLIRMTTYDDGTASGSYSPTTESFDGRWSVPKVGESDCAITGNWAASRL
jgi:hypothetical protein